MIRYRNGFYGCFIKNVIKKSQDFTKEIVRTCSKFRAFLKIAGHFDIQRVSCHFCCHLCLSLDDCVHFIGQGAHNTSWGVFRGWGHWDMPPWAPKAPCALVSAIDGSKAPEAKYLRPISSAKYLSGSRVNPIISQPPFTRLWRSP